MSHPSPLWQPEPAGAQTTLVLFGATGDLCRRKLLPALYRLSAHGLLPWGTRVIATSPEDLAPEQFATLTRTTIEDHSPLRAQGAAWDRFRRMVSYVRARPAHGPLVELTDAIRAAEAAGPGPARRIFYLAVPPSAFPCITERLVEAGLSDRARIVYEKPFGQDQPAFRSLLMMVRTLLGEEQVYSVDHFLAKEAVRQVMRARFSSPLFDGVWNREHIDNVQIDVPETLGVGARGGFYEQTGALKDMAMTHLLTLLAVVAMEGPASPHPQDVCDARAQVLRAVRPLDPQAVVRGQYEGYRSLSQVHPESDTETFLAAKVRIDNDTWTGVPFFLRTGKRIASDRQCIRIAFKTPVAGLASRGSHTRRHSSTVRFDLRAGDMTPSASPLAGRLEDRPPGEGPSLRLGAYEHLLLDVVRGERKTVVRADAVARTWDLVRDVLDQPPPIRPYAQGSWGPAEAQLLPSPRRWWNACGEVAQSPNPERAAGRARRLAQAPPKRRDRRAGQSTHGPRRGHDSTRV